MGGTQQDCGIALRSAHQEESSKVGRAFQEPEVSVVSLGPLDGSCFHFSPSLVAANTQSLGHQALCIREALGISWEDLDSPFIRARQAQERGLLMQERRQEPERGSQEMNQEDTGSWGSRFVPPPLSGSL